jgi:hypothetical protein
MGNRARLLTAVLCAGLAPRTLSAQDVDWARTAEDAWILEGSTRPPPSAPCRARARWLAELRRRLGIMPAVFSAEIAASMHGDAERFPAGEMGKAIRILYDALRETAGIP